MHDRSPVYPPISASSPEAPCQFGIRSTAVCRRLGTRSVAICATLTSLMGAGCTSGGGNAAPTQSTKPPSTALTTTPGSTTVPATAPACVPASLTIDSSGVPQGVTGGGVSFEFDISTTATCRLTGSPGVAILDSRGRIVSFGVVDLAQSNVLAVNETNVVLGEWRNLCTAVSQPFRIEVLLENSLHTLQLPVKVLPTCFENGAPTTPTAPPPSGSLNLSLQLPTSPRS